MRPRRLNILLVEDDPVHAKIIWRTLESKGHIARLAHVADGEKALDFVFGRGEFAPDDAAFRPDLMLLDVRLPTVDGFEVLRTVKTADQTRTIPVVMVSTSDDPVDVNRSYELGANAYVSKPADFDGLSRRLTALDHFWSTAVELPR